MRVETYGKPYSGIILSGISGSALHVNFVKGNACAVVPHLSFQILQPECADISSFPARALGTGPEAWHRSFPH